MASGGKGKKALKRLGVVVGLLVIVGIFVLFFTGPGEAFRDLWKRGVIQAELNKGDKRPYDANNEGNLKAMRTALMLFHDSEGRFPSGDKWMDSIENRITASDMTGDEAKKKLVRPDLSSHPGEYGYAMNDKAAGKYKDDAGPTTILVFESKSTGKNAHGDPVKDGMGAAYIGITVEGKIVRLSGR